MTPCLMGLLFFKEEFPVNKLSKQVTTSGLLIATGLILPMVFHTFALGGMMFLPMHIPILLGGFLLTPLFAVLVGITTPVLSSLLTGMPPFFPQGIQMVFELSTYAFVISYLYHRRRAPLYPALIASMLAGRTVAGVVNYFLLTYFFAGTFNLKVFISGMFITALPGIAIQLVMIPIMVRLLENANVFCREKGEAHGR